MYQYMTPEQYERVCNATAADPTATSIAFPEAENQAQAGAQLTRGLAEDKSEGRQTPGDGYPGRQQPAIHEAPRRAHVKNRQTFAGTQDEQHSVALPPARAAHAGTQNERHAAGEHTREQSHGTAGNGQAQQATASSDGPLLQTHGKQLVLEHHTQVQIRRTTFFRAADHIPRILWDAKREQPNGPSTLDSLRTSTAAAMNSSLPYILNSWYLPAWLIVCFLGDTTSKNFNQCCEYTDRELTSPLLHMWWTASRDPSY